MFKPLTYAVDLQRGGRGNRRVVALGPAARPIMPTGRVPRVARLMALALRFAEYLRNGQISSYKELAELGHVSRARMSQIMALLNLAPDLQAAVLFLPATQHGRDCITLQQLDAIAAIMDWRQQRRRWRGLTGRNRPQPNPSRS
jgi:hypothetical protein